MFKICLNVSRKKLSCAKDSDLKLGMWGWGIVVNKTRFSEKHIGNIISEVCFLSNTP